MNMREVKFRGLSVETGEWVYGYYGKLDTMQGDKHCIIIPTVTFTETVSPYFVDHEVKSGTVGEFTGLKDKNGVEIYEGDILKWDESEWGSPHNELVEWNYGQFDMRMSDWAQWCEIIGNIYENPKLLEDN